MDRLNRLAETLNELSHISKAIIQKLLPLMEEINEPNNDFIVNLRMQGCQGTASWGVCSIVHPATCVTATSYTIDW